MYNHAPNLLTSREVTNLYSPNPFAVNFLNTKKGRVYKAINIFSMSLLVINMTFGMTLGGVFMVAPGEALACNGVIKITKQTVPDGSPQSFGFTNSKNNPASFSLTDNHTQDIVYSGSGTYVITENETLGWGLTNITCSPNVAGIFTVTKD